MKNFFGYGAVLVLLIFVLTVACAGVASEQNNNATTPITTLASTWTAQNPGGGGAFNSPIISATGAWVVGSDLGGACISTDAGASWRVIGATQGLRVTHVASLAAHPVNGNIVIGTDDGIYTASATGTGLVQRRAGGYVSAIVFSPANPSVVYAAIHPVWNGLSAQIFRSNDAGVTWNLVGALPTNLRVVGLRIHPIDYDAVIALVGVGRFASGPEEAWITINSGANWWRTDPNLGPVADIAYSLDSDNLNRMYLTTNSTSTTAAAFFKSEDAGGNWLQVGNHGGAILAEAGRVRVVDPSTMKPWTTEGVWNSTNQGATWSFMGSSNNYVLGWSKAYQNWGWGESFQGLAQTFAVRGQTLLSVDSQFIYASNNGGTTFAQTYSNQPTAGHWRSRGCDNLVPETVAPSKADANLIYAGYHDLGLFRSDDAGNTWIPLNEANYTGGWLGHGGNTMSVVPDPSRANVVWAQLGADKNSVSGTSTSPTFLARSTGRGAPGTWTIATGFTGARIIGGISVDPRSTSTGRRVFATSDGKVMRSTNDGQNFSSVFTCACNFTWVLGTNVYAGGGGGLWRSNIGDTGTWTKVVGLPAALTPTVDFWADWFKGAMDMAIHPTNTNELWVAVRGFGFYRSTNAGVNWALVKSDALARSVALDASANITTGSSSATVAGGYNAASNGAMIGTRNATTGAITWASDNAGLAYPFVTQIRVAANGVRWLVSPGQGVMRR